MLEQCFQCEYPLAGLPANHQCPECGTRYDEHTYIWRRRCRLTVFRAIQLAFVFFVLFIGLYGTMLSVRAVSWSEAIFMVVTVLGFIPVLLNVMNRSLKDDLVVLAPDGVYYRLAERKVRKVPWSTINSVRADVDETCAIIEMADPFHHIAISEVFPCRKVRDEFVTLASKRLIVYGQ